MIIIIATKKTDGWMASFIDISESNHTQKIERK